MSRWLVGLPFVAVALFTAPGHRSAEQVRLRVHFDSVLVELRARDVSMLSASQRTARRTLVRWLAEYRDHGLFPVNDQYADTPTPIFRDARGATCAMAYLIERSGRRDIVDRVAGTRNLAYIRELAGDMALIAWLDSAGLTVSEAARIQPAYDPDKDQTARVFYTGATIILSGSSIGTTTWNILRPSKGAGLLGIVVGAATVFIGTHRPDENGYQSAINLVTGAFAIVTGVYALERPEKPRQFEDEKPGNHSVAWGPILSVAPMSGTARVGLSAKF